MQSKERVGTFSTHNLKSRLTMKIVGYIITDTYIKFRKQHGNNNPKTKS